MKSRTIITTGFTLALLAGVALGVLADRTMPVGRPHGGPADRPPVDRGGPEHDRKSWLAEQLDLTPQQREQMDAIWSDLLKRHGRGAQPERWRESQKQRDEAIVALLTPEQKVAYDRILSEHQKRIDDMAKEREKAFADAVEATNKILNPEQRAKYAELLKKRRGPGGPGGPNGPGGGPPPPGMMDAPDGGPPRGPHTKPTHDDDRN